jgi:Smr domain-containing protein
MFSNHRASWPSPEHRSSALLLNLEVGVEATYHRRMLLDFLFSRFRRALRTGGRKRLAIPITDENEDNSLDPDNPFPEVVTIEFRDVIDLHSIPPRQVRAVVEDYIEEAHRRGASCLRIIHGKGIGVQREMVRSILQRASYVVDFRDAPAEAGSWGATVVTLRVDDAASERE